MQEITIRVRPLVAKFAEEMERRLSQRDESGDRGWLDVDNSNLASHCERNIRRAVEPMFKDDIFAKRSAVDAANYAMFVWDKLQLIPSANRGNDVASASTRKDNDNGYEVISRLGESKGWFSNAQADEWGWTKPTFEGKLIRMTWGEYKKKEGINS